VTTSFLYSVLNAELFVNGQYRAQNGRNRMGLVPFIVTKPNFIPPIDQFCT